MTRPFDVREHFGRFADRYDEQAFNSGYGLRAVSEHELSIVDRRLGVVRGGRVLDVGVGTGRFARMLIQRGADVIGIDLAPEMLNVCAQNEPRARLVQARLGSPLPFANGSFDHAICIRVMKYLDDWVFALGELRRVVRSGGRVILEVANRRSLARWGYSGMPIRLMTARETAQLLDLNGFRVQAIDRGMRLPFPLYRWARTKSRLRAMSFVERVLDIALGPRILARSLIFTCEAYPVLGPNQRPAG
jgi:ubiquinone/menaquinone biosynthesis C-methylase UbiE